ncbi:YfiR family protein [Terricaulis sp.]|uniref:YfiR family protein n=1 Tax=Terricaulis sp. TaxID=2768686 RepID=UPI002AC484CC|nr:YfiR family protein [Terricaulis sp.]MDZ4690283.1 YfiR family protein [Terricaulis sp.]
MRLASILLAMSAIVALGSPASAQTAQEEVKATFIYRFVSYIGWPPASFPDAGLPVQLCVIGADPLARTLERATMAQRVGARHFEVRRIGDADDIDACHVLYVVGDRTAAALRAARRRAILSITSGGSERGVIHFTIVDARVRFYIDDALAEEGGLTIDPRLLNLALSVRRRSAS